MEEQASGRGFYNGRVLVCTLQSEPPLPDLLDLQGADDDLGDPSIGYDYADLAKAMGDEENSGDGADVEDEEEPEEGDEGEGAEDDDEGKGEEEDQDESVLDAVDALPSDDDEDGDEDDDDESGYVLAPGAAEYLAAARARSKARGSAVGTPATAGKSIGRASKGAETPIGRAVPGAEALEPGEGGVFGSDGGVI